MKLEKELKMTEMTVKTLILKNRKLQKLGEKNRSLRGMIAELKKERLITNNDFVVNKAQFRIEIEDMNEKLKELRKKNDELQKSLNNFVYDHEYVVDPDTGIIDMTQPQTPKKLKRKSIVRSVSCGKKLKFKK